MRHNTYKGIAYLEEHFESRGKLLQVILAKAFEEGGCLITECNVTEGKDLVLKHEGTTYELEVKTTTDTDQIRIQKKDLDEIHRVGKEDNIPGFAVLRLHPNAQWWISTPEPFTVRDARKIPITALRTSLLPSLQQTAEQRFSEVLEDTVRTMKEERYHTDPDLEYGTLKQELLNI